MHDQWRQRIWREFNAGNLTRSYRDVLLTLAGYGPRPWPSHETLAARARCCTRTVQRALEAARGLDLVSWAERRIKAGWRWLRTSNIYRLLVPDGPVAPATGHKTRGEVKPAGKRATRRSATYAGSVAAAGPAGAAQDGHGGATGAVRPPEQRARRRSDGSRALHALKSRATSHQDATAAATGWPARKVGRWSKARHEGPRGGGG